MKKKEILIIFVLAVLVTGGSYFLPGPFYKSGAPLPYFAVAVSHYFTRRWFVPEIFVLDFLFCFLVIFGIWQVVKWVKRK